MADKTKGQRLYEHECPKMILVIRWENRHFSQLGDAFWIPNPAEPTDWKFITAKCKASWEVRAEGHSLFSGEK